MDYLALPVTSPKVMAADAASDQPDDTAWNAIMELLFDDDAKAFAESAKSEGIPAPSEDDIGYEVTSDDGEVIATVEIAWPDRKVGFMTVDQMEDKATIEALGWHIIDLLSVADAVQYLGGDK